MDNHKSIYLDVQRQLDLAWRFVRRGVQQDMAWIRAQPCCRGGSAKAPSASGIHGGRQYVSACTNDARGAFLRNLKRGHTYGGPGGVPTVAAVYAHDESQS